MDFESILDKWENRKDRGRSSGKPNTVKNNPVPKSPWLDSYLPSVGDMALKDSEKRPPVSEGRSIWNRRPHQDSLDLHGLSGKEAREELSRFIRSMRRRQLRKGLIIHGKGLHSKDGSVLAPLVQDFLESSPEVGEFGRATKKDGGSGASWFLLRQRSR